MKIETTIGEQRVVIGETSKNHVTIYPVMGGKPVEFHLANWRELKEKVDKMFKAIELIEEVTAK